MKKLIVICVGAFIVSFIVSYETASRFIYKFR